MNVYCAYANRRGRDYRKRLVIIQRVSREYHMVLLSCHLLKLKEEVQLSYSNGMDVFRRLHPDLVKAKTVLHKYKYHPLI